MNALDWWEQYLVYSDAHEYTPADWHSFLRFHLAKEAREWYQRCCISQQPDTIFYIQDPARWAKRDDIYTLYQGKSSVLDFVEKVLDTCQEVFGLSPHSSFHLPTC